MVLETLLLQRFLMMLYDYETIYMYIHKIYMKPTCVTLDIRVKRQ